ncbi:MAG: hypothetical protein WAM12_18740, partial [Pseudolabrys sp.]
GMVSAADDAREGPAVQSFPAVCRSKFFSAVFLQAHQKNPSDCRALRTTLESFQLYIGTHINH